MITRYTLPEQLSSRLTLQISPKNHPNPNTGVPSESQAQPGSAKFCFTQWTELHPSRLLPAYALQSILNIGQELKSTTNNSLPQIHCHQADPEQALLELKKHDIPAPSDLVFSTPIIVEEGIVGESLSTVCYLAKTRGWQELPLPLALGILISTGRSIEYLHALGYHHGAICSDHIYITHVSQEPNSVLASLNGQGSIKLTHWVQGQLFQLTPIAENYGRGTSADCKALLWLFLEMLGGEESVTVQGTSRLPFSRALSSSNDLSVQQQNALKHLPPPFAEWVLHRLIDPPQHMGIMLGELQRVLDPQQAAFDPKGVSRWVTRLLPERAQLWERLLTRGETQSLQHLVQPGGILTVHQLPSDHSNEMLPAAQHVSSNPPHELAQSSISHESKSTIKQETSPSSARTEFIHSANNSIVNSTSEAKNQVAPSQREDHHIEGTFLERLDVKLNRFEKALQSKFTSSKGSKPKLQVATIWLDTVRHIQTLDLDQPITVGTNPKALIKLPFDLYQTDLHTLFTPSGSQILVHSTQQTKGWLCPSSKDQKSPWSTQTQAEMTTISLGAQGLIQHGQFAIFFHYTMVDEPQPMWLPTLPIPSKDAGLFWSFAFAASLHLALLVLSYSSKNYTFRETGIITTSKFVEVLTQKIEEQKKEEEIEEEEEPVEELVEASEEVYEPQPEPNPTLPKIRENVKELARERFGKGQAAVDALADFLSGKNDTTEGKLALGDVSAALGTSADSGLSLGSAFGEAGGSLNLGGPSGSLNTSGGLSGSRKAGSLKAKRVKRRVRGKAKVKVLRSRARLSGGSLSKAAVLKVIMRNQAKISACYERQLIKAPNLNGKLTIAWVIKTNGKVTGVKQVLSSMNNAALKSCVFKVIKGMKFPKPKGGNVKVKYSFVFQQG